MHYFDHASTSFPKPQEVIERMQSYLTQFGVSPGRGSYQLSQRAEELVEEARGKLAKVLKIKEVNHIAFTMNATHGLNIVIKGYLQPKDHVLICGYSHNAALRPLDRLKRERGVTYDVIPVDQKGQIDLALFRQKLTSTTRLFIATGASNVIGVKADFKEAFGLCRSAGVKILFDSTPSLGYQDVDMESIDFVVGTGHKSLLGPSGVGFLYVKNASDLPPYIEGGSHGNHAMSLEHPEKMPYKFEAGTINTVGIAGLLGALDYIHEKTFARLAERALAFTEMIWKEISCLDTIVLYGTDEIARKVPIISFNLKRIIPSQIAAELDKKYNICVRSGLHCAPLIHKFLGTLPTGCVRISTGHQNSEEEVALLIEAIKKIH
ncbi:MAG: aminotransferase class V-fold PLP-dependent enzyme [Verrucomicrobia bacterium]|nr:aminotransferase class V-fold PLP-dependent enzyme [Verrucomicrobiota bacterium]